VGPFYPPDATPSVMLALYARAFGTVEVDSTAYAIPPDQVVRAWRQRVPPEFVMSAKLPQTITHERRLRDTAAVLRKFVRRMEPLGERLGPLLVQLSPGFRATDENREVLREFLDALPEGHRWAFEFRHAGWLTATTMDLLRRHRVALVLADSRWVRREMMLELAIEPTADFGYLRWVGMDRKLTDFSRPQYDREREIGLWAEAIRKLRGRVGVVYGYVSNYFEGHAPHTIRELQRNLGLEPVRPDALREQVELF
jgi:uncharacterized protein YecE (DUF72 family)